MTSYAYTLVLDDGEAITLEAALDLLSKKCEQELAEEVKPPFLAWQSHIVEIRRKLNANMQLMSTNTFS